MLSGAPKSNMTYVLQFVVISTVVIALIAVLKPELLLSHGHNHLPVESRMADLGRALAQYSDDYDGALPDGTSTYKFPLMSNRGMGWASQVFPYVVNHYDFNDGLGQTQINLSSGAIVSYAYNRNGSRNPFTARWTDPARTIELYQVRGAHAMIDIPGELSDGSNSPQSPSGDGTSILLTDNLWPRRVSPGTGAIGGRRTDLYDGDWPLPEVDGGSFYLLGDGHVRWMTPSVVSSGANADDPSGEQTGSAIGFAAGTENRAFAATFSTR
jgi:hypothetical protein